jgi:cell division septation protein DedD
LSNGDRMNKNLPLILLIILAVALSGCTGSGSESPKNPTIVEVQKIDHENTNLDARVVEVKLVPEDIRAGEKVTAELLIANIGIETITNETIEIKATVQTLDDTLANVALKTMNEEQKSRNYSMDFNTVIKPGTNGKVSAVFKTIEQMQGRSLAGTYKITITLSVNGQKVEARIMPLTLLSGTPREFTPVPTSTPAPTPTRAPTLILTPGKPEMATPSPTPSPEPTPYVAATPTGKNYTIYIKGGWYNPANLDIDAGDMVNFVNKDDSDYILVEMDKKIPDMLLRIRTGYVFNTTGNYRIGLYFKPMRGEPRIVAINVRHNESNASN